MAVTNNLSANWEDIYNKLQNMHNSLNSEKKMLQDIMTQDINPLAWQTLMQSQPLQYTTKNDYSTNMAESSYNSLVKSFSDILNDE